MKKISDYIFDNSWRMRTLNWQTGETYRVLIDIGDLKKNELVKFIGYADVDNHFGIFIFTDSNDNVREVSGDFSSPTHSCTENLNIALSKV